MTEIGSVYGASLYELAREEALADVLGQQLAVLQESFRREPDFLRLLSSPNLSKAERCAILDDSFRGKLHPYILNFLKILTEKNYARHFSDCCDAYADLYNQDNGILIVTAVSAVQLTPSQKDKLTKKLDQITGKQVKLNCRIDPSVYGGIRLDYDGKCLDDTVSHRLDAIRQLLDKTVL